MSSGKFTFPNPLEIWGHASCPQALLSLVTKKRSYWLPSLNCLISAWRSILAAGLLLVKHWPIHLSADDTFVPHGARTITSRAWTQGIPRRHLYSFLLINHSVWSQYSIICISNNEQIRMHRINMTQISSLAVTYCPMTTQIGDRGFRLDSFVHHEDANRWGNRYKK